MSTIVHGAAADLTFLKRKGDARTPIVLLHGIGSHANSFASLMYSFEGRSAVIAWDAPGYGSSAPLAQSWPDASDYAAALDRLLAELDIRAASSPAIRSAR